MMDYLFGSVNQQQLEADAMLLGTWGSSYTADLLVVLRKQFTALDPT